MDSTDGNESGYTGLLILAGALSLAAGILHGTVVPEHLQVWWGYGFFFMLAAMGQITYGLLLFMRPWAYDETGGPRADAETYGRPIYVCGAVANLAIITLYIITRTAGIPMFGPEAGNVEPFTPISVTVSVLEAALVAALFMLARRSAPAQTQAPVHVDRGR